MVVVKSARVPLRCKEHAFTYLTVLIILAILSAGLALVGEVWHTAARRDKEAELLFVGNEYRKAIERYYLNGPAQYPRKLEELIKDPRTPTVERYLRQLYPDPITGKNEWGLIKAPDGGIMGVHSLSQDRPLKTAHLSGVAVAATKDVKYSDWKFVPTADEIARPRVFTVEPRGAAASNPGKTR